jgi:hypothetical protein
MVQNPTLIGLLMVLENNRSSEPANLIGQRTSAGYQKA